MKGIVSNFFKQTFRRHTNMEYAELLTRGMRGKKGINHKYPWAYCRFFALLFVLLAVFLLIVRFTYNELFAPTIIVLSSTCFNLSFLIFLYELYPKRDLSFLAVILAMLIGGTAANVVSQILFDLFPMQNAWLSAVCTGFFEELPKAVATLTVLIVAKNRSPLAGFMFGAAVGCGFSIVEDMGYIFLSANELSSLNLTTVIETAFARGATAFCTHILWTGAIGWAFNISKRMIANIILYPVILLSCGLHIAWDLPLNSVANGIVCGVCALIALLECAVILKWERNKVFAEGASPVETATASAADAKNADEDTLQKTNPAYWKHWGYVSLVISAVLMAIIACIYCWIPFRERYGTETFTSSDTFIEFMQDGVQLSTSDRQYDSSMSASDLNTGEFIVQSVDSTVMIDGKEKSVTYYYLYYGITKKYLYNIEVLIEGMTDTIAREDIYHNGELYASFYRLTKVDVTGYNIDSRGNITVFIYDADYARDLSDPRYTSLFYTFAALTGAGAVCYISLRIKSWRVKKQCLTQSVSSAE